MEATVIMIAARRIGGRVGIDPLTLAAIINALVQLASICLSTEDDTENAGIRKPVPPREVLHWIHCRDVFPGFRWIARIGRSRRIRAIILSEVRKRITGEKAHFAADELEQAVYHMNEIDLMSFYVDAGIKGYS